MSSGSMSRTRFSRAEAEDEFASRPRRRGAADHRGIAALRHDRRPASAHSRTTSASSSVVPGGSPRWCGLDTAGANPRYRARYRPLGQHAAVADDGANGVEQRGRGGRVSGMSGSSLTAVYPGFGLIRRAEPAGDGSALATTASTAPGARLRLSSGSMLSASLSRQAVLAGGEDHRRGYMAGDIYSVVGRAGDDLAGRITPASPHPGGRDRRTRAQTAGREFGTASSTPASTRKRPRSPARRAGNSASSTSTSASVG